jgi:putative transcriptional regulatory protein
MRQLDSSIGQSIAEEQKIAATNVANGEKTLSGISAIEQGESCPRLLAHPDGPQKGLTQNSDKEAIHDQSQVPVPWSYLFIRKRDAEYFSLKAETEGGFRTFIHRTIITDASGKPTKGKPNDSAQDREASNGTTEGRPTISGLIFIQGKTKVIRKYLWERFPQYHLVNDCSTRKAAVIPDSVMQPFMRIANTDPSRIRFLVNPLTHYAEGNTLVEIMTGPLAGLQGYIIRIDRDRKLVIGVGDMTVAIGGVHKENFEKVEEVARAVNIRQRARRQAEQRRLREGIEANVNVNADVAPQPPDPRLLTPIQQKVDTAFFTPETFNDILVITTNIELWTERARRLIQAGNLADASEILTFLLEEIGYWFTNIYKKKSIDLTPVKRAGNNAYKTALTILDNKHLPERTRQDLETNLDSQILRHGYIFIMK